MGRLKDKREAKIQAKKIALGLIKPEVTLPVDPVGVKGEEGKKGLFEIEPEVKPKKKKS